MSKGFFKTYIYLDADGWTVAKADTGQILSEAQTNVEAVIQAALDRKGPIAWSEGTYDVSSSSNIRFKDKTTIYSSRNTILRVPNGFTGSALNVDISYNSSSNIHDINIVGGLSILEAGSPAKLWKALHCKLNVTDKGITDCNFNGILATGASDHTVIDIINNTSWITSCYFVNNSASLCVNGINFINTVADPTPGVSTLMFRDFWYQGGTQTLYGAKGIIGNNHTFQNCSMWDMHTSTVNSPPDAPGANAHSAEFLSGATNMLVIGGIMMHHNLVNNAAKGQVRWIDGHGPQPQWDMYSDTFLTNGDGFTKSFTIPHGLGLVPKWAIVDAVSTQAAGTWHTSWDGTNIYVNYTSRAPPPATPSNQNNVRLFWRAAIKAT